MPETEAADATDADAVPQDTSKVEGSGKESYYKGYRPDEDKPETAESKPLPPIIGKIVPKGTVQEYNPDGTKMSMYDTVMMNSARKKDKEGANKDSGEKD